MLASVIFRVTGRAEISSFLFFFSFLLGVFFIVRVMRYSFGNWFAISVYAGKILPGQPI